MTSDVTRGSANVFADLGFENPDEELLRGQLAMRVRDLIKGRRLTQSEAAKILRIAQPDVSAIVNGRVSGFSLERLLGFIRRLGDDVDITIRQSGSARAGGRVRLRVAS